MFEEDKLISRISVDDLTKGYKIHIDELYFPGVFADVHYFKRYESPEGTFISEELQYACGCVFYLALKNSQGQWIEESLWPWPEKYLSFAELNPNERFMMMPVVGDKDGYEGLRAPHDIFLKVAADETERDTENCIRRSNSVIFALPAHLPVIRISPAETI